MASLELLNGLNMFTEWLSRLESATLITFEIALVNETLNKIWQSYLWENTYYSYIQPTIRKSIAKTNFHLNNFQPYVTIERIFNYD